MHERRRRTIRSYEPREGENSEAARAPRRLEGISNHTLARRVAGSRALLLRDAVEFARPSGAKEIVWGDEQDRAMIVAWFDAIEQYGTVDSQAAAAITRERFKRWGGGAMTPPAVLEQVKAEGWYKTELQGLAEALAVAGGVPQLKDDPAADDVAWIEDARGWLFGKLSGTIDAKAGKFARPGAGSGGGGETIGLGDRPWSITLTGDCNMTAFEMEPEDQPGESEAVKDARAVRRVKGTFVHEFAHTLWPRFKDEWATLLNGVAKSETAPTTYAKTRPEEDFCESFMLHALYRERIQSLAPKREAFFTERGELLNLAATAVPAAS